jgi:hypothetical protein
MRYQQQVGKSAPFSCAGIASGLDCFMKILTWEYNRKFAQNDTDNNAAQNRAILDWPRLWDN